MLPKHWNLSNAVNVQFVFTAAIGNRLIFAVDFTVFKTKAFSLSKRFATQEMIILLPVK